jgi:hypothetical protein
MTRHVQTAGTRCGHIRSPKCRRSDATGRMTGHADRAA